jgi:GT2 family glycosyltransferase
MLMDRPVVSVLVLTWNGRKYIPDCLKSLFDQDFDREYEVIVVDNGSTDGSADLASACPRAKVHRLDRNYGFCLGNNIGFDYTRGRYVVFLNQDVVLHRGWLRELVAALESDSRIQAAHANIIQPWYPEFAAMERTAPIPTAYTADVCSLGFVRYRRISPAEPVLDTLFLHGVSVIVRRELIEQLGYAFDPDMFSHGEDLDLALRIRASGYRTVVATRATLYHKHTLDANISLWAMRKTVRTIRNRLLAFWKCCTWLEFAPIAAAILVGSPLNAGEFGLPLTRRLLFSFLLIPPTMAAVVTTVASMPRFAGRRRQTLSTRRAPAWWFVRALFSSRERLRHQPPEVLAPLGA